MLTDKQIDEFDLIALKESDTPPGVNPSDWMRSFATQIWNAAQTAEREACETVCIVAEINGNGAHYCAAEIRKRSNLELMGQASPAGEAPAQTEG